ncbi:MAG: hypothetical protein LBU28_07340 [Spirochaetaceae bacterium]|nr:hypothetical protein [Spirochaetaceae bacterium]
MPVADVDIDEETKAIADIGHIYNHTHVPPGVFHDGTILRGRLNQWWTLRGIPSSRDGIQGALELLNVEHTGELSLRGLGLSLSDHYWIRPLRSSLEWDNINYYAHGFSEDVGDALFGKKPRNTTIHLLSPDVASNGNLKKRWKIINGKRVLVKGGSGPYYQEPVNEAIASLLLCRLNIPHVEYHLYVEENMPFSLCENFTDGHVEFIGAWDIATSMKKKEKHSELDHYLECCKGLGIPGVKEGLEKMLAFDFLIVNSDRHYYNFGALRNSDSLEWLGPAPLFDCGSSLWYQSADNMINPELNMESKPFRNYHSEQIRLVRNFDWFNADNLYRCDEECEKLLSQSVFITKLRRDALCKALNKRIGMLESIVASQVQER